jgi:nucleoside-diphosphate-sugar epimerase
MKRIIITGAKGFVGQKLYSYLVNKEYHLTLLDKIDGDDLTQENFKFEGDHFDIMVHLAALSFVPDSFDRPEVFYRTNILSTLTALELCRKYKAKLIFLSSYVYGIPEYLPIDELHPLKAYNPYAQSKLISEQLCEGYYRDFNVPVIILRPFNIFGNGQNEKFLISTILKELDDGKREITLKDPYPRRDYVHVDDVVNAIYFALNSRISFGAYNICSNASYSVKDVTEIISRNVLNPVKFDFESDGARPSEVSDTRGSFDKIFKDLGWQPKLTFEQGIIKDLKELKLL